MAGSQDLLNLQPSDKIHKKIDLLIKAGGGGPRDTVEDDPPQPADMGICPLHALIPEYEEGPAAMSGVSPIWKWLLRPINTTA